MNQVGAFQSTKEISPYQLDLDQEKGKGQYGKVYVGRNKETKEIVAIKMIEKKNFQNQEAKIESEIRIMQQLNHQHLVKFIDCKITTNNFYIIMEYCEGGTLNEYIKKKCIQQNSKYLAESEARIILRQILSGYKHLYDKKIVHRDLKPSNILIKRGQIKIADFGLSKILQNFDQSLDTYAGTPLYMSPQLLLNNKQSSYTSKSDIWSIGVIFYEILFGKTPWGCTILDELKQKIKQALTFPDFPAVSQEMKDIITKMLQFEEKDRMSWDELFSLQNTIDKNKQQTINDSLIKIKNETDKVIKRNLEKNLYINDYGQNIEHARKLQLEIEKAYPNIILDNQDTQTSPVRLQNQILTTYEYFYNYSIIQDISGWVNHKRNKSIFINNLVRFIDEGTLKQNQYFSRIISFLLSKYQFQILQKPLNNMQSKQLNSQKMFTNEQWKIFCSTQDYQLALELIKSEFYILQNNIKDYQTQALKSKENFNHPLFYKKEMFFKLEYEEIANFKQFLQTVLQFYFKVIFYENDSNNMNEEQLKFCINLQQFYKKMSFKYKIIDWFKMQDQLQNLSKQELIEQIYKN